MHLLDTERVLAGSSADPEHLSPLIKALGNVARRIGYERAQKYDRFTLTRV